jgi:uncharacterized protein YdaT
MPWKPKDAKKFTAKAKTPKQKRQWKDIANANLEAGKSEGEAIKIASGVVKKAVSPKVPKQAKIKK